MLEIVGRLGLLPSWRRVARCDYVYFVGLDTDGTQLLHASLRRPLRLGLIALAVTVAIGTTLAPSAGSGYSVRSRKIGDGVRYTRVFDPKGPWRIKIVSVRLSAGSRLATGLAHNKLNGHGETTSSMARRNRAIAAVNGDFGWTRPVNPLARRGKLVQLPHLWWGRNFAVDHAEMHAYFGRFQYKVWADETDTAARHDIRYVNGGSAGKRGLALFTPAGSVLERPPKNSCSARLLARQSPRVSIDGTGVEASHSVAKVACRLRPLKRREGSVLATPRFGTRAKEMKRLRTGDRVDLGWSPGWPNVFETLGGYPVILADDNIAWKNLRGGSSFYGRHPRTGVGFDKEKGRILLITVDGRRDQSVGMTLGEFARLYRSLGAEWALNLDGGGSTTTVVRGDVVNRPSDGSERPVSSSLLVLRKKSSRPSPRTLGAPITSRPARLNKTLLDVARDQGSTGGLASALDSKGVRLTPELSQAEAVARRMERSTP
jgi:hypothetical protein